MEMRTINGYRNIINLHNRVGADIIRPRSLYKFINAHFVGCGDLDAPLPLERHGIFDFTDRGDSPCGCPLSAQPIQGYSNCNLLTISFYLRYAL